MTNTAKSGNKKDKDQSKKNKNEKDYIEKSSKQEKNNKNQKGIFVFCKNIQAGKNMIQSHTHLIKTMRLCHYGQGKAIIKMYED